MSEPVSADEFPAEGVYSKCVKSCVFIVVPQKEGHAKESGSLIDVEKRLVITNYHVVAGNDSVTVQFPVRNKDGSLMTNKRKYLQRVTAGDALKGKVLYRDKTRDLALVELDKLPPDTPALPLAKASAKVGETVIDIGSPGRGLQTFSVCSEKVRAVEIQDFRVGLGDEILRMKCRMVTMTNPRSAGDSGGPVIDKRGYQVAVVESAIFDGAQNVNHSIDVTEVRAFLAEKKITIKELSDEPDKKSDPPAPGVPSTEDEKAAVQLLNRAKLFADNDDNRPVYIAKLMDVIAKYPGTVAAREVKKKLDGLK